MPCEPLGELLTRDLTAGHRQDDRLLLIDGRDHLDPVQHQERLHRRVSNPLVAIYEGVILNEEVSERSCLLHERRIEITFAERLEWLKNRGLECTAIPNAERTARLPDHSPMDFDDLLDRKVEH